MRLVIGGPTRDTVPASFAIDLAELYTFTKEHGPWTSVAMRFVQSTYVHVGREEVLKVARSHQASHVLWLDTDMTFPRDAAIRLAQHGRPVVACNCVMKTKPPVFTAKRHHARIETTDASSGLEAVDEVGMAVMLIHTSVLSGLADRAVFRHGVNAAGEDVGEDIQFCRLLTSSGVPIVIDHDLSREIGHIGQFTFRPDCAAVAV